MQNQRKANGERNTMTPPLTIGTRVRFRQEMIGEYNKWTKREGDPYLHEAPTSIGEVLEPISEEIANDFGIIEVDFSEMVLFFPATDPEKYLEVIPEKEKE